MKRLLNVEQALHLLFERDVAEGNAYPESEPESEDFDDERDDPSFVLEEEREEKEPPTSAPSGTRRSAQRRGRRSTPTRSQSPLTQAAEQEARLHSEPWKTEEDADTAPAVSRFQPRRTPGVQVETLSPHSPKNLFLTQSNKSAATQTKMLQKTRS
ncbi:hypothetical protein ABVT39_001900 [Epinephelus coioides]